MKRSATCRTCGVKIRPRAKDMSLGAAVRKHYWARHPEVMLAGRAEADWSAGRG
jgi:hypothetical protein